MYPHDNIFSIYYNIGKRTPFLVKRCELGLARSSSEERRIDPNQDRTFLVETVKPRGKYGKAYGKCFVNGKPDDTYRQECYPNIKDEEIPCAGCGEWVLIDVPGVSLDEIFPIHKADEILMFGKYKGKTYGDIYKIDYQYLHWLEKTDRLFKVNFEELKQLYPDVEKQEDISIADQVIDFGKYKGQKFRDIKDDISYLEWLVSIDKISIEDFELLSTIHQIYSVKFRFISYLCISIICGYFHLVCILTKFHGFRKYWYYLILYFGIYFVPLHHATKGYIAYGFHLHQIIQGRKGGLWFHLCPCAQRKGEHEGRDGLHHQAA